MNRLFSIAKIKSLPYALALAFACAWMIDPSLTVPQGFADLIPISRYPHLIIMMLAFILLAVGRRWITTKLSSPVAFASAGVLCILCLLAFPVSSLLSGGLSTLYGLACCFVIALYQAAMLVMCLMVFARLSMIDCVLTLIAWQLFVALLRAAATLLPGIAISCCAAVAIAVCFATPRIRALLVPVQVDAGSEREGDPAPNRWFPVRLMLMNALVIFTIQSLQGFSPESLTGVSFIGSFIAISLTVLVLALGKRVIRIRQLYNSALIVMELGIVVFSIGGFVSFRLSSILLDAAYLAFVTFFFTVLCNTCQRNKRDAVLIFCGAYLFEQLAAFSGEAMALAVGPGVHALPLALLAALGAVVFTCFPTEEDYQTGWQTSLGKPKHVDPASYFYSLSEVCSSFAMQYSLSRREADVLLLLAQKKTTPQISDDLVVSVATVKTHVHNIYKKLGVHSRKELFDLLGLGGSSSTEE